MDEKEKRILTKKELMRIRELARITYHSCALEGSSLTEEETFQLLLMQKTKKP